MAAKKSSLPKVVIAICGCLIICTIVGVIAGVVYWYLNRDKPLGPTYNEEPIVDIIEPTGSNWYATYKNTVTLSGIVSDDEDKIDKVEWSVEGGSSGEASGTESWNTSKITLKKGDNNITVKAYDKSGNVGEDNIFIVFNKEVLFVDEPTTNPDYIFKGDPPQNIVVQAQITKKSNKDISKVVLYRVTKKGEIQKKLGAMKDSGKVANGDDIPNDGNYGYKGSFSADKKEQIYLRVVTEIANSNTSAQSGVFNIDVLEHTNQQTVDQITQVNQQVNNLVNDLQQQGESQGNIANQVNDLVSQQDNIAANGISEQGQGVWWVYENTCIPGGVLINPPDTKGGIQDEEVSLQLIAQKPFASLVQPSYGAGKEVKVGNTKAIYLGPYLSDFGQGDDFYGAWEHVKKSKCPKCDTVVKKNEKVQVEDFKNLDKYGIIVVSSHGDNWYGGLSGDNMCAEGFEQSQVIIYTSQKLTKKNLKKYEPDLMARRLAVGAGNNLIILPSYISHYNSKFPNSLVYISTCRGAYNNSLASAFLGNGAKAYYGYDDYVSVSYAFQAGSELFENFLVDKDTSKVSFEDAIQAAGSSDGSGADFMRYGKENLIMGGDSFANLSFETGDTQNWSEGGDARVITSLGPIKPQHGDFMAIISTGLGSVSESKSSINQQICFGEKSGTLKFDYNLISEEPMEYLNTQYDDKLEAFIIINGKSKKLLSQGVNNSSWNKVSGINFEGGDTTTYQTGWSTHSYSLKNVKPGAQLQLRFRVSDVGDSAYDTAAVIDNIRIK